MLEKLHILTTIAPVWYQWLKLLWLIEFLLNHNHQIHKNLVVMPKTVLDKVKVEVIYDAFQFLIFLLCFFLGRESTGDWHVVLSTGFWVALADSLVVYCGVEELFNFSNAKLVATS